MMQSMGEGCGCNSLTLGWRRLTRLIRDVDGARYWFVWLLGTPSWGLQEITAGPDLRMLHRGWIHNSKII